MQIRSPLSGSNPTVSTAWSAQLDDPNSAAFKALRESFYDPGNVPDGKFIPQPPIHLPAVQSVLAGGIAKPSVVSMPSPNYGNRPAGTDIDTIVLHHTASGGTAQNIGKFFQNPAAEVSAHYTVGKDGTIVQSVPDSKRAWHAGTSSFKGEGDVNDYSIGIEIVNLGNNKDPYTEAQYNALIDLVAYLVKAHDVPMDRITGHRDVALPKGRKADPSDNFDWSRVRRGVEAKLNGQSSAPPAATPSTPPAAPTVAPTPSPEAVPATYTVRKGDSLSKIARDVLGDMNRWREIYDLNKGVIGSNPNLIHPGMTLKMPAKPEAAKPETKPEAPKPETKPEEKPAVSTTPPATTPATTTPATSPATQPATMPVAGTQPPSTPVLIGISPAAVWAQIQAMTQTLIAQVQPAAYPQAPLTYPSVTYPQTTYPQATAPTYVPTPTYAPPAQWTGPMVAQAYPAAPTAYATAPSAYPAAAPAVQAPNPLGIVWVG